MAGKAKYWQAVLYPENLIPDWKDEIAKRFQVAGSYCVHDKCKDKNGDPRKEHVHCIIAFSNTTTEKMALQVFKSIEAPGKQAIPNDKIQQVFNVRNAYDYLIHDTDDCRKKKKYAYDKSERVSFNNFDIGNYEQLSKADKLDMIRELADYIIKNEARCWNLANTYMDIVSNFDDAYFEIYINHNTFFGGLVKGNYHKRLKRERSSK